MNELTTNEQQQLEQYEAVIATGLKTFVAVGLALLAIRDDERKLYRQYGTFEDYCLERWGLKQSRAYQLMDAAGVVRGLQSSTIVELPANEAQARPLAQLPSAQQITAWQTAIETAPDGKITAAHVQAVVDRHISPPHVAFNSGNNEWYTPPEYIEAVRAVMGGIDLDPASSEVANRTVGASIFYTAEDNGLFYPWSGRVWMNPPYASNLIGAFCDKLAGHVVHGDITEACVLVNNATETGWFNALLDVAACVCFIRSRVRFIDADGNPSGAPLQGQALLYIGQNVAAFARAFSRFGVVLYARRD